jgi:hypothetical protein
MMTFHSDLFDGWFDDRIRNKRVLIRDGKIKMECPKNAVGQSSPWAKEIKQPWTYYPDVPVNANAIQD